LQQWCTATSTTILNPIEAIGGVIKDSGALFMVDAVSSLGGVHIEVDAWGIDLCPSASQKCLGATPGLAPVSISAKAWKMIDRSDAKAHGWYTNLQVWREYARDWGDWHPTPVTMPVSIATGCWFRELLLAGGSTPACAIQSAGAKIALGLRDGMQHLHLMRR
jgi:alanine-glyoxylate transaminase/serine-glyoxylate transaminase/serine-pyruvate transaminase